MNFAYNDRLPIIKTWAALNTITSQMQPQRTQATAIIVTALNLLTKIYCVLSVTLSTRLGGNEGKESQ